MKLCKENCLVNNSTSMKEILDIYCQSNDTTNFKNRDCFTYKAGSKKSSSLYSIHKSSKFHENLTLLGGGGGGADSILEVGSQKTRKLSQLPPVRSDFHETLQGKLSGQ